MGQAQIRRGLDFAGLRGAHLSMRNGRGFGLSRFFRFRYILLRKDLGQRALIEAMKGVMWRELAMLHIL